jgi:Putative peptidoglycan binding domain
MRKFNIASLILAGRLAFARVGGHGGGGHFGSAGHVAAGHYSGWHGGYWYGGWPWWGDDAGIYDYDYYPDGDTMTRYPNTVVAVQQELAKLGYYHGPIDGIVDPQTDKAISWFQSVDKLTVTGQINGQTLKALQIS